MNATDRNRLLSLQGALDILEGIQVDLRIARSVHEAKEWITRAIVRIQDDLIPEEGLCLTCGQGKNHCVCVPYG